jgi:hypothetical protein
VAKAFSGAVALSLVRKGRLELDDTIGERLPTLPRAWHAVTIRQMLNHTSGPPDYTRSERFAEQADTNPRGSVHPSTIIDWVSAEGLEFPPGSRYEYSTTDNIVVALIAAPACCSCPPAWSARSASRAPTRATPAATSASRTGWAAHRAPTTDQSRTSGSCVREWMSSLR